MAFWDRVLGAIGRLISGGQAAKPGSVPEDTEVEIDTTTQITNTEPTYVPQEDQIAYTTGSDCNVQYLKSDNPRVLDRWRVGYEGGPIISAACVRELIDNIPYQPMYALSIGGFRVNPYPKKDTTSMYLSILTTYETLRDYADSADTAEEFANGFPIGLDLDGWESVYEISVIDRVPDS